MEAKSALFEGFCDLGQIISEMGSKKASLGCHLEGLAGSGVDLLAAEMPENGAYLARMALNPGFSGIRKSGF